MREKGNKTMSTVKKSSSQKIVSLEKMTINQLREVGKGLDILGATNMSKTLLESQIVEKVAGKNELIEKFDEGRPDGTYEDFNYAREILKTCCASPTYESEGLKIKEGVVVVVDGHCRIASLGDEFSTLSANSCPYVDDGLGLRQGDNVEYSVNPDNDAVILSINGLVGCERLEFDDFDTLDIVYPTRKYSTIKSLDLFYPISCGGRNVFVGDGFVPEVYATRVVKELSGQCKIFVLTLGVSLIDKYGFEEYADEVIELKTAEKYLAMHSKLSLLMDNLKRLVECGKQVIVYIPDYIGLKWFIQNNNIDFNLDSLFRLGACYSSGGSISVITSIKVGEGLSWFEQLAINIVYVDRTLWGQMINLEKSQTLFLDKILTREEIEHRNKSFEEWSRLDEQQRFIKFEKSE